MKNILVLMMLLVSFSMDAQVNTIVRVYHKLGAQQFQLNGITQNNLTQDYKITRLQYYMTKFSIIHDGGQITAVSEDTVALINATDGSYSSIDLGTLDITNVESVKFHIGVHTPVNNGDPSIFKGGHPLAPQNPSMHWGWAAGYRFLVYEGVGGTNFSQTFQLHGLGNDNYFETTVNATGELSGSNLFIALDADYTRGVENIDVSNGVIAHGVNGADLTALENFRDFVFSQSTETLPASIVNHENDIHWEVFPNPSTNGNVKISVESEAVIDEILITNLLGDEVERLKITKVKNNLEVDLPRSGVYIAQLLSHSVMVSTKRIVIQ